MATNGPKGGGRRGAIKNRDQVKSGQNKRWTKRGKNKKFMDQKYNTSPFKGVRKKKRT